MVTTHFLPTVVTASREPASTQGSAVREARQAAAGSALVAASGTSAEWVSWLLIKRSAVPEDAQPDLCTPAKPRPLHACPLRQAASPRLQLCISLSRPPKPGMFISDTADERGPSTAELAPEQKGKGFSSFCLEWTQCPLLQHCAPGGQSSANLGRAEPAGRKPMVTAPPAQK